MTRVCYGTIWWTLFSTGPIQQLELVQEYENYGNNGDDEDDGNEKDVENDNDDKNLENDENDEEVGGMLVRDGKYL